MLAGLKVLHINDYSSHGGAEVLIAATIRLLRAPDVDARLFSMDDVPGQRLTAFRYIDNSAARNALSERLQVFDPDVVHLHNFYHALSPGILAELAAYRRRRPLRVVMTAHDYHLICPNSGANWFQRSAQTPRLTDPSKLRSIGYLCSRRWDLRGWRYSTLKVAQHLWSYRALRRQRAIDVILCPSRFIQGQMQRAGLPTYFLPNPAPMAASPRSSRSRAEPLRLVFAGRIEPEKGLAEFLEMLPPNFTGAMTIAGEGRELERCRRIGQQRMIDDRIQFIGRLPHAQTMSLIADCHVLVLPSLWWENCPMSLLEALAVQTNILVCGVGGMKEIVQSAGVGYMFMAGDPRSLHAALDKISRDHRHAHLNDFNVSLFLKQRSEQAYLAGLVQAYAGDLKVELDDASYQDEPSR